MRTFWQTSMRDCRHFHLEGFTLALFQHSELLKHLKERHADMVRDFHSYKYQVPVYGCVLLNSAMDKLVMVCNWEGTSWGLPRGKVNEVGQTLLVWCLHGNLT